MIVRSSAGDGIVTSPPRAILSVDDSKINRIGCTHKYIYINTSKYVCKYLVLISRAEAVGRACHG